MQLFENLESEKKNTEKIANDVVQYLLAIAGFVVKGHTLYTFWGE